jgi:hypothetical protein
MLINKKGSYILKLFMEKPILSKSTLEVSMEKKSLYLYKHNYNLEMDFISITSHFFNQGLMLEFYHNSYFLMVWMLPLPDHFKIQESGLKTKEYIDNGNQLFMKPLFN